MNLRFLADENIDPALVWAADEGRVLISKDIKTIPTFAHERIAAGLHGRFH